MDRPRMPAVRRVRSALAVAVVAWAVAVTGGPSGHVAAAEGRDAPGAGTGTGNTVRRVPIRFLPAGEGIVLDGTRLTIGRR